LPVNDVVSVMGHENASTTLDLYTHRSADRDDRVRRALADFCPARSTTPGSGVCWVMSAVDPPTGKAEPGPSARWSEVFVVVVAMIDRLVHHAEVIATGEGGNRRPA
jgi:hypothetical protein